MCELSEMICQDQPTLLLQKFGYFPAELEQLVQVFLPEYNFKVQGSLLFVTYTIIQV